MEDFHKPEYEKNLVIQKILQPKGGGCQMQLKFSLAYSKNPLPHQPNRANPHYNANDENYAEEFPISFLVFVYDDHNFL